MRHRLIAVVSSVGILMGAAGGYLVGFGTGAAEAIPAPQRACAFDFVGITQADGFQPITGTGVTISNGTVAREVVVTLSADLGVDTGAEVRLGYSIDGGAPQENVFGPANLANHQEFFEARMIMGVIPIAAGNHTIQPFWRVSGALGTNATIDARCFVAEGRTK